MKGIRMQKGITLIALIITIVVLVILAGVAISAVSDSGIIGHAKNAQIEHEIGEEKEKVNLSANEAYLAGLGTITEENLDKALESNFGAGNYSLDSSNSEYFKITITKSGREYKIYKNGKVESTLGDLGENNPSEGGGDDPLPPADENKSETQQSLERYFGINPKLDVKLGDIFYVEVVDRDEERRFISNERLEDAADTIAVCGDDFMFNDFVSVECSSKPYGEFMYIAYMKDYMIYKLDFDTENENKITGLTPCFNIMGGTDDTGKIATYGGKEWTILHDEGEYVEMMINEVLGELTLGEDEKLEIDPNFFTAEEKQRIIDYDHNYRDMEEIEQLEKAIYSYNNGIEKINNYCIEQIRKLYPSNGDFVNVRSIGYVEHKRELINFNSEYFENTFADTTLFNGRIYSGLNPWLNKDLLKMDMLGIERELGQGSDYWYWIANPRVKVSSNRIYFDYNTSEGYDIGEFFTIIGNYTDSTYGYREDNYGGWYSAGTMRSKTSGKN